MYDLSTFSLKDMAQCSADLRKLGANAKCMEEVAGRVVKFLYENLTDADTHEQQCALVRLFKTHPLGGLDGSLQTAARSMMNDGEPTRNTKCLTLLATAGSEDNWNDRTRSAGHKAIPLPSPAAVDRIPMISQLINQFGLDVSTVVSPDPELIVDLEQTTFNVFHVPDAVGSPHVPAQEDFVVAHGIKSVLGFGGMFPSGNLFAVIMFARVPIPRHTADQFESLALSVKLALLPHKDQVFSNH